MDAYNDSPDTLYVAEAAISLLVLSAVTSFTALLLEKEPDP